jgi:hypothetical protein
MLRSEVYMSIVLENKAIHLEFSRKNGALIGLRAIKTGWEILNRPHLGQSFRLLVPLPGRRNNPVFSEKQELSSIELAPDNRAATFIWDGVTSEDNCSSKPNGKTIHFFYNY